MTSRTWIAIGAALVVFLQVSPSAQACSCIGAEGLDILSNNAAVFEGHVRTIEYLEPDTITSEPPIRVTFDVNEVWKGPVRNTLVVSTIYNKFSCTGYHFTEGQVYLVAARTVARDEVVSGIAELEDIHLCGGTRLLSEAGYSLREFGKGQRPQ